MITGVNPARFPHSEIPGSKLVCSSPGLIAAYHVLHRLLTPRHPPYALNNLTLLIRLVTDYQRFVLYHSIQLSKNESHKGFKKLYKKSALPSDNSGGGKRVRTAGLLVANQMLSQLSYTPLCTEQRAVFKIKYGGPGKI